MELYQLRYLKQLMVNINLGICVVTTGLWTVYLKYTAMSEVCVSTATDMTVSKANIFLHQAVYSIQFHILKALLFNNFPVERHVTVQ